MLHSDRERLFGSGFLAIQEYGSLKAHNGLRLSAPFFPKIFVCGKQKIKLDPLEIRDYRCRDKAEYRLFLLWKTCGVIVECFGAK